MSEEERRAMVGRPSYPQTRRKYRKRRPVGGSAQEQTYTRIWRDYIEGILSWDDRCRLGKLYGSGTVKRKETTMITIRELTKKCSVHGTPLASKPVEGTEGRMNGRPFRRMIGRLYWCPICDHAAKDVNYSR